MPRKPFDKAGPGRPKGSQNKLPINLRDKMIAIADDLEKKGKGLGKLAISKPEWFYENFYKPMLPKNVDLTHVLDEPLIEIVRKLRAEKNTVSPSTKKDKSSPVS